MDPIQPDIRALGVLVTLQATQTNGLNGPVTDRHSS